MIKLGANSVLFQNLDLASAMEALALIGYDGIELSAIKGMCEHLEPDRWREQADGILDLARKHDLELLSIEAASLDAERLEHVFGAAQAMKIPVVNVGPGGKSNVEEDFVQLADTLTQLAKRAAAYGVVLCVKAHVGGAIHNTPTTLRMMKMVSSPAFGIDMDPSHIFRSGEKPEEALPAVLPRVRHIHIRDCKGRGPSPGVARDQACGRGDINLEAYCRAMVKGRYSGPVNLEVIGAGECSLNERIVIAAETYGFLNAIFKSMGAR